MNFILIGFFTFIFNYSGSKRSFSDKIKMSWSSTKFCGGLSLCMEDFYSKFEGPRRSGTFQVDFFLNMRNL